MSYCIKNFITSTSFLALIFISNFMYANDQSLLSKGESGFPDHYNEKILYQNSDGNVLGDPNGVVTVIDFSDFFCIPCRDIAKTLDQMAEKNKWLRVVYVDYPMLGEKSIFAAKVALAASYQGKYLQLHHAMLQADKPLEKEEIFKLAKKQNINLVQLNRELEGRKVPKNLLDNLFLGNAFGIKELPTLIIGYTHSPHQTTVFTEIDPKEVEKLIYSFQEKKNF